MLEYLIIFVWFAIVALVVGNNEKYYIEEWVDGVEDYQWRLKPSVAFIIILPVILLAGFRSFWFADTGLYVHFFRQYPDTWEGFLNYIPTVVKDRTFYITSAFIKLVTDNARVYLLILAFFQGLCLYKLFRKYSENYLISIFLFVASTDMYSWMFNGLRQFTAVSITICGLGLYVNRRYIPAILLIMVASLFHQSALLMIPFIFIAQGEVWNKKTILFMLVAVIVIVFTGSFLDLMDAGLQNTQYSNVVNETRMSGDDGANPIRALVYAVPAILSLIGRRVIEEEGNELIDFCANMSIISAGFYLIATATSGIFIGRIPIYFSLYGYILLPWAINHIFPNNKRTYMTTMIVLYIAFYSYQMFSTWYL